MVESAIPVRAIRAYLHVEADAPITFYTGKLVKTLLYSLVRELNLYHGLRGIVSLLHISPLFKPGKKEWELGEAVTPVYAKENEGEKLKPMKVNGEYIIHIGGVLELIEKAMRLLEQIRIPLQIKISDTIVRYKLEKIEDITNVLREKTIDGDKVVLYLKAPTKLFNVYTKSKLPKFNISAVEIFMTPFMFYTGQLTIDNALLLRASNLLGNLVETYYSITTVRPILVPFNERKTPALTGKITYIVETRDTSTITNILQTAEITGIGQSRLNGFGTTTWR